MQKNVMPVRMFKLLQSPEASYKQYQSFCHHSVHLLLINIKQECYAGCAGRRGTQELCATEKSGRWQTRCSSPLAWMPQHYVPKSVVVQ